MNKYEKYLIISIPILLLIIALSIVKFELVDEDNIIITTDSEYTEPGYYATTLFGKDISDKVEVDGFVDTNYAGTYKIYYRLKYLWIRKTLEREVIVEKNNIDNLDIILVGKNRIYNILGNKYVDDGAYVLNKVTNTTINSKLIKEDNIDSKIGEYKVKYILNYDGKQKVAVRDVIVYEVIENITNEIINGKRIVNIEINGINNFSYVELSDGRIIKDRKFSYEITNNTKNTFDIHTQNNDIITYAMNTDNSINNYKCEGIINRNGTTLEVISNKLSDVKKYEWIIDGKESVGQNKYTYPNSIGEGLVKLSLQNGKKINISCDIKDNLVYHFKYDENNVKPKMTCNTYTMQDKIELDMKLKKAINDAGYGTRAGVVEAARFLVGNLNYTIPYVGASRYDKEGLNIGQNNAWGCSGIGLDCFYFIYWTLSQNNLPLGALYAGTKYKTRDVIDRIKVGDYIYTPCIENCENNKYNINHIGLIIGIDDNYIYVAEEATGKYNSLIVSKWDKYNMPSKGKFSIVKLVDYEKEGNLTNMWVE